VIGDDRLLSTVDGDLKAVVDGVVNERVGDLFVQ
jgi:hypothetical protein